MGETYQRQSPGLWGRKRQLSLEADTLVHRSNALALNKKQVEEGIWGRNVHNRKSQQQRKQLKGRSGSGLWGREMSNNAELNLIEEKKSLEDDRHLRMIQNILNLIKFYKDEGAWEMKKGVHAVKNRYLQADGSGLWG